VGISSWSPSERPRERLLAHGASALTDAELVAILLRTGVRGKTAIDLAREMIERFKGLNGLFGCTAELKNVKGLGAAKRAQLEAAMELARRSMREQLKSRAALTSPTAVRDYLRLSLATREHEVFMCIWLDAQHKVLATEEAFRGTLTQTSVYPREIVKAALRHNAAAVIFAHNHPSGVAEPSRSDELLTRDLASALALIEVKVLDHFVVAGHLTVSFAERGLL